VARALRPAYPLVVHPQFTEPEAALAAAGHDVRRHVLTAADGFRLNAAAVEAAHAAADLIVVGNPTNPTSVLHPRGELARLLRPGRVLVVDEAFMDLVPGEPETLIDPWLDDPGGLLVLRSLTKTWGIAGLRLGYVVGDPALVGALAAHQPPWSVSTPAIAAGCAALTPAAQDWARRAADEIAPARADLAERLTRLGLRCVEPARAPYLLVDTSPLGPGSVREALAARGFAVRRGETFPGLGPTWIRLAVRDPATHAALATALAELAELPELADLASPPSSQPSTHPVPKDRR
jgi:histidinol-phosphate/aromatic aminotransferase/cobyric acid decarboxylase-like protein